MVFWLDENKLEFPDPARAEEDGLLAVGGDLSTERLWLAYQNGIFPWFSEEDPICWFSPHERCVIFPDEINVSGSMRKLMRKNYFTLTTNQAFEQVIANCATIDRPGQDGTWITGEMQDAYIALHKAGKAHSIEVWRGNELAGGMYGVRVGDIFCGESMFSKKPNASKAALIWVCSHLSIKLLDCQLPNPHLMSLGARMISRRDFDDMLGRQPA